MISIKPRKTSKKTDTEQKVTHNLNPNLTITNTPSSFQDDTVVTSGATGGDDVAMEVTVDNTKKDDKKEVATVPEEEEEIKSSVPILDGLSGETRSDLLRACVNLIGVPVDPDALNAVMRVSLRLTQVRFDFEFER